jgi:SPP1 gp7 family putative phage head morphogenesis protein
MSTPTPDGETETELDTLEAALDAAILAALATATHTASRAIEDATAAAIAASLTADALRAAAAGLTTQAAAAAPTAVNIGAAQAHTNTPTPAGDSTPTRPEQTVMARILDGINPAADIAFILDDAARTALTLDPRALPGHVTATAHRLRRTVVTTVHRAANRGRLWYARTFGMDLVWVSENDYRVCPICAPMDGTVVAATEADLFTIDNDDPEFNDLPPAHHMCRCSIRVQPRQ